MDLHRPQLPIERASLHVQTEASNTSQQQQHLSNDSTSSCDSLMTQIPHPFYSPQSHQQAYNFVPHSEPYTTPTIIQDSTMQRFPPRQQVATPSLNPTTAAYVPNSYQQSFGSNSSHPSQNQGSMGNFSRSGSMGSVSSYQPSQIGRTYQDNGPWVPNAGHVKFQGGTCQNGDYPANNYQGNNFQTGTIPNHYDGYNSHGGVISGPQYEDFGMQPHGYGVAQGEYNNQYGSMQPYPQSVSSPGISYSTPSAMSTVMEQPQAYSYNSGPNSQMNSTYSNVQSNTPFSMTLPNHSDHIGKYDLFNQQGVEQMQMRTPFPYVSHSSYAKAEYAGNNSGNRSVSSNSNYSTDRVKAYAREFGKGKGKSKRRVKNKSAHGSTKSGQAGDSGSIDTLNKALENLKLKNNLGGPVYPSEHKAEYAESSEGSSFDTRSEISELKQAPYVPFSAQNGEVSYS